jgi:hypothetical protein
MHVIPPSDGPYTLFDRNGNVWIYSTKARVVKALGGYQRLCSQLERNRPGSVQQWLAQPSVASAFTFSNLDAHAVLAAQYRWPAACPGGFRGVRAASAVTRSGQLWCPVPRQQVPWWRRVPPDAHFGGTATQRACRLRRRRGSRATASTRQKLAPQLGPRESFVRTELEAQPEDAVSVGLTALASNVTIGR